MSLIKSQILLDQVHTLDLSLTLINSIEAQPANIATQEARALTWILGVGEDKHLIYNTNHYPLFDNIYSLYKRLEKVEKNWSHVCIEDLLFASYCGKAYIHSFLIYIISFVSHTTL